MTLHHIALGAQDVEGVAGFYRDLFKLPEHTRHRYDDGRLRSVWLDLGGAMLTFEHTTDEPRHVHGVNAGPFLLAFATDGPDERTALEQRLAAKGVAVEERA